MFPVVHGVAGAAAAGAPYVVDAVDFDGTNDYLTRGGGLTGAVDGKTGAVSVWWKTSASGLDRILHTTGAAFSIMKLNSTHQFRVKAENSSGDAILRLDNNSGLNDDAWHHILCSWDLADTGKRHLYVDDASDIDVVTYTDDDIDYTVADWSVGAQPDGSEKWPGCIADLWFEDTYIDLSIEANRRKFIDASGKPVDLGADGSTPTGSSPLIFFSGATVNWHTNKGTGGGFTENGALTDCADSPSD